ncbi:MAG: hypothetical protein V3S69_06745 [Dehalococcoidales bacterium]
MSQKDRATLLADLLVSYPNNSTGLITPAILRGQQTDIIDSYLNIIDEGIGLIPIKSEQDWIDNTVDLTGGRRQMPLNASYRLLNPVTRSFSLVCNGVNSIRSENFIVGADTYSGATNAAYESTTTSDGLLLKNLQTSSLLAPWILFTDALGIFGSNSLVIAKDLGSYTASAGSIYFMENFQHGVGADPLTSGLDFTGSGFTISMTNCSCFPDNAVTFDLFDLGVSTWDNVRISDMEFNAGAPNTCISGAASGANLNAGGAGFVNHSNFGLSATPLSGVSSADDPWIFTGNLGPADSGRSLGGFVDNNASATAISVGVGDDGNPIQVNLGVLATTYTSERLSMSTAGLVTYEGANNTKGTVTFGGLADAAAGNNVDYTFYVAINGTVIPGSRGRVNLDAADPGRFAAVAVTGLTTGDTAALFVENNTNETDITITDLTIIVS